VTQRGHDATIGEWKHNRVSPEPCMAVCVNPSWCYARMLLQGGTDDSRSLHDLKRSESTPWAAHSLAQHGRPLAGAAQSIFDGPDAGVMTN